MQSKQKHDKKQPQKEIKKEINKEKKETKKDSKKETKKHQQSSLPKKPSQYDSIYFYTKFLEMGYGTFSDPKWKINSPITAEAFQTIYLGIRLHNKIQLEKTIKNLYINANPVTSIIYLLLLSEYISLHSSLPKFLQKNGEFNLSEFDGNFSERISGKNPSSIGNTSKSDIAMNEEKEEDEMVEKLLEKINVNKKVIYVNEQEKEEQKKMKEEEEMKRYCDKESQELMREMNECCLHLSNSLKKFTTEIENDLDCLMKMIFVA